MINLANDQCPLYPGSSGIVIASLQPHSPPPPPTHYKTFLFSSEYFLVLVISCISTKRNMH